MQLYQRAFGKAFDPGIEIPVIFIDQSYKNDVCPCFVYRCGERQILLWVDFETPEQRELPDSKRYTLELRFQGEYIYAILATNSQGKITRVISGY